jgi:hypothetical protein
MWPSCKSIRSWFTAINLQAMTLKQACELVFPDCDISIAGNLPLAVQRQVALHLAANADGHEKMQAACSSGLQ